MGKTLLIKVCNPYCGPCANAHVKIDELLEKNHELNVKIIFTATNDKGDIRSLPAKHLLAIAENKKEAAIKKALDDSYLAAMKDYENFKSKYPLNGELLQQNDKIEKMSIWCKEMNISFTPTIFLNGYQLPDAYSIEDLEHFLLE